MAEGKLGTTVAEGSQVRIYHSMANIGYEYGVLNRIIS